MEICKWRKKNGFKDDISCENEVILQKAFTGSLVIGNCGSEEQELISQTN